MLLFSLFDRKLREYAQLVQANNAESVKRALLDGVRGSKSLVEKYPQDFDLMELGEFDVETGVILPRQVPLFIDNLGSLLGGEDGGNGQAAER